MDVITLLRACVRRWYILIPLLAATVAIALVQARGAAAQYSASASVLLTSPKSTSSQPANGQPVAVNPIGSTTLLSALPSRMLSDSVAVQIARAGGSAGYAVVPARLSPIIRIQTGGDSASSTLHTLDVVIAAVNTQLISLQKQVGAPARLYYHTLLLSKDSGAAVSYPQRTKNVVIAALAGVVVTVIITDIVDVLLLARRKRSRAKRVARHEELPSRDELLVSETQGSVNGG